VADTVTMAVLIILMLVVPTLLTLIIKARIDFPPDSKLHFENDIERTLNEAVADEKFESTLHGTIARKKSSARMEKIRSPEEFDYQISPRRDRVNWKPSIPGIVHQEDQDWSM